MKTSKDSKESKRMYICKHRVIEYVTKDKTLIDHRTVSRDQFLPANLDDPANDPVLPHPQQSGVLLDRPRR